MAEIKHYSGYTLSDLQDALKWPWREFAEWADVRLPPPVEDFGNRKLGKFRHGFHSPCAYIYFSTNYQDCTWRVMVRKLIEHTLFQCTRSLLHSERPPGIRHFDFFQFALGLSDKDYLADAFRQKRAFPIARKADKKKIDHAIRQVIAWKRHGTCINKTLQEAFAKLSDGHLAELRWLRWAMRRPFNHERSFWAQVRDRLKDEIGVLVATDKLIEQRRPLGSVEHDNLSYYCSLGRIKPTSWLEESGDITVENVLMPDWRSIDVYEIDQRVEAILVPIAYQLAMRWKDSQAWPRFVVTCRNPACGQKFYSALPNAVACPKRKGEFGPSKCKRGWDNYSKWLKNICEAEGTDPEKVWDEPQRKKEFLKTWRPRRPQSPYS